MTSRPAVPESETPETDAALNGYGPTLNPNILDFARSLERRLSLAQTEIKGHMRTEDDLKAELAEYQAKHTAIMREADRRYDELIAHDQDNLAELDKAQARIAELEKDAARYWTKKHIDCLKFMETSGYKACKDTDSLLIAWNMSYDAAIDAALKSRA